MHDDDEFGAGLLTDAQFITSRPNSPLLKPVEVTAAAAVAAQSTPSIISVLEEKANGL